jgi:hypothetical protein
LIFFTSASRAQSYRILNPKVTLYGSQIDLKLNGFIGPPEDLIEVKRSNVLNNKSEKILRIQLLSVFPVDFFNKIDQDPNLACLAQASYWESRGESFKDKIAVANVVMNRTRDPRFPNTACRVVRQNCQFRWHCAGLGPVRIRVTEDNKYDHKVLPWVESILAALIAKNELIADQSKGATHFYAHKTARPSWALPKYVTVKHNSHTFIKLPCKEC